ncbi:MAG: hypothetical protein ABIP30_01015 [Ferruginibacter sp.]
MCCIFSFSGYAQQDSSYEEVDITLNCQNIGSADITSIIFQNKAYLPVKDLFDYLKIKNTVSPGYDSLSGFLLDPSAPYVISKSKGSISFKNNSFRLGEYDLILSDDILFLNSDQLGKVFGLDCVFNFRSLSINLTTSLELPVIREKKQELMRQNIARLKGERKADTTISKRAPFFHLGAADWDIASLHTNGFTNNIASLGLGGNLAGGEADLYLKYNNKLPFNLHDQFFLWRHVNNDNTQLRQIKAGTIFTGSTATLSAHLNGVQFNNIPTTYKTSFGTYLVTNTTEPGWIVELYVNDVLVDYTKADGAGFFKFEVPMVYGSSVIKYRFYGPWGESRSSEQTINIPFTFLPEKHFEYSLTAGILSDGLSSKFSRLTLNYGLNKRITIGSGAEYLSSSPSAKLMPFANVSLRLLPTLILSGEQSYGVVSKANLNYRFANKIQLDVNYLKYTEGQTVVKTNYLDEKKAVLSMPFQGKHYSGFGRLTIDRVTVPDSKFTTAELLLGGMAGGINANITTFAYIEKLPVIYSKLSMTFRLPKGIRFTPQIQYDYSYKAFNTIRGELEKKVFRNTLVNIAYEKNSVASLSGCIIGVRRNFSFAQTNFSARVGDRSLMLSESVGGGLLFDKNSYVAANDQKSVGKGGLLILPFLDYNCNGKRDKGEPDVKGLIVRVSGGLVERDAKKAAIRVSALEAYNKYFVTLDENSFDNPAWKITNKLIEVTATPNNYILIEVPVAVVGEVSGTVFIKDGASKNGIARIIVNIYDSNNKLVAKTLTEFDGYFSYFGLAPGNYKASVDEAQLEKIKMLTNTAPQEFKINIKNEGDIVEGLEFIISKKKNNANE